MPARHSTKRRVAKDDEFTVNDETMEKAMAWLKDRLKPEDLEELMLMLKGQQADDDTPDEEDAESADELPKPGGKMVAVDSRGGSYGERWPEAARIKVW